MVLSPSNALRSSLLAVQWLPSFGLLLAVFGCIGIWAGVMETPRTLDPPLGMALPEARFHAVAISSEAAHRAVAAPVEAGQGPAGATAGLVRITAVDRTATDHRSRQVTTQDSIAVDDVVPDLPGPDDQRRSGAASGCLETARARSTPAESADPRDTLMAMASGHDVGSGMRSCACLMMGLACPDRGHANSDDRIANALFASTEGRDARWDIIEMAGVQGGAWTRQCPCPVYVDTPGGGPR
jgi:hypothetical protein